MDLSIVVRVLAGVGGFVLYFLVGGLYVRGVRWLARIYDQEIPEQEFFAYFMWPLAVAIGFIIVVFYGGYLLAHSVARLGDKDGDDDS